ncbi:hypothetical protein HM1_1895 [Heliomicrobium modesticaldum Ice1]|uniref:Uncharacterized protein n=1 Tax=Heliobacterium modesticaldum (strain ATCC 51547 / Ice1) TaxID=498761 RepID=B0TFD6_HELMI|nr:hypothetical protein [Heliomicrobium modesticaldum]ABZ84453.1 hypothetical protein HM1_1895 [Heliomicrobium modesticaldum Ice1]
MAPSPFFQAGDRVITYNAQPGTVVDVITDDDDTKILLIKIDNMPGEYAYECTEVTHAQSTGKGKATKSDPLLDFTIKMRRHYA